MSFLKIFHYEICSPYRYSLSYAYSTFVHRYMHVFKKYISSYLMFYINQMNYTILTNLHKTRFLCLLGCEFNILLTHSDRRQQKICVALLLTKTLCRGKCYYLLMAVWSGGIRPFPAPIFLCFFHITVMCSICFL